MDNQMTISQPKGVGLYILIAAFFLSLYIFVLSPLTIVMGNVDEFVNGLFEISHASLPYFLKAFALLALPCLIPNKHPLIAKIKAIYLSLLAIFLTFSVINTQFMYGNYGEFDGRGLEINKFSMLSFSQLAVLLAITLIVIFTKLRNSLVVMTGLFSILTFSMPLFTFLESGQPLSKTPQVATSDFVKLSKDQPNYLYILLDEVYGGSTEEIFNTNKELAAAFTGFTNYTNTATVFPTTIMAVPAILTEKVYQDGENQDEFYKKSVAESPLLNTLEKKHYDYKLHTLNFKGHIPQRHYSNIGSLGGNIPTPEIDYRQNLNLSLFKIAPDVLKEFLYVDGEWRFSPPSYLYYIKEFDHFADHLEASNQSPTFRFFHTTLTHSPVKFDRNCQALGKSRRTFVNCLGQDTCGFVQVARIINKLKELGIYDNTYMIISSDHGRGVIRPDLEDTFSKTSPIKRTVYGHGHATLMIKPFNSNDPFKNDATPRSLLEMSPLILASINNEKPVIGSTRKYSYYKWEHEYWGKDTLPPILNIYTIGNDIKNPNDWVPDARFKGREIPPAPLTVDTPLTSQTPINFNVDFSKQPGNTPYASQGLSNVEDWGRWSDGKIVKLGFLLKEFMPQQVTFQLRAQLHKNHPLQHATVSLNGIHIGDLKFEYQKDKILRRMERTKTFTFNLPPNALKPGVLNTIEFHIDSPVSPESLGINDDERLLGLGFESMTFQ